MQRKRLFWSIGTLGLIILAFAVWMLAGEWLWRNPEAVSDSEDAVVQPSVVPEVPASPEPYQPDQPGR